MKKKLLLKPQKKVIKIAKKLKCEICDKKIKGLGFYVNPKNTLLKICPRCFHTKKKKSC